VCVPECPIDAIVADNNKDIDVVMWYDLNKRLSLKWPNITKKKDPLADHEQWNNKPGKLDLLEE
jgi:ferredoxin